jgi:hypothetical protein
VKTRTPTRGRATTPTRKPAADRRPKRILTFPCPMCGGDATLTGRGDRRSFDCTLFTTNDQ